MSNGKKTTYLPTTDGFMYLSSEWAGLKSFCMVEAIRATNEGIETNRRYFISSLGKDKEAQAANAIRAHWQIENALHWRLDVVFNEDQSRARTQNAAKKTGDITCYYTEFNKENTR